ETRSGDRIGDCSIGTQVLPRRKIGGALVTKIGLARADVLQVGACFRAFGVRFYCSCRRPVAASFAQQLLNRLLGSAIIAFSEMMMANLAFGINQIVSGPIAVFEGTPDPVIVVDCNRIADLEVNDSLSDIVDLLFERKFRGVHTDYDQSLILVFLRPGANVGQSADAIDAGLGPEIHQYDLAAQLFIRERG